MNVDVNIIFILHLNTVETNTFWQGTCDPVSVLVNFVTVNVNIVSPFGGSVFTQIYLIVFNIKDWKL